MNIEVTVHGIEEASNKKKKCSLKIQVSSHIGAICLPHKKQKFKEQSELTTSYCSVLCAVGIVPLKHLPGIPGTSQSL